MAEYIIPFLAEATFPLSPPLFINLKPEIINITTAITPPAQAIIVAAVLIIPLVPDIGSAFEALQTGLLVWPEEEHPCAVGS
jgi:hypothetical protein